MTLKRRIIVRLDIKGSKLIKGIRFEGSRVIGNPCEAAYQYYLDGIDEIYYSDAVASLYGRNSLEQLLTNKCEKIFVPITAGGGIKNVEDGLKLIKAGADKVAVNTFAVKNPVLIKNLKNKFGKQCVVLSIQARRSKITTSGWEIMTEAGRERTGLDLTEWIEKGQMLGAGEIFLTSVDKDGTRKGPDLELIELVSKIVKVPLIVGGGFNSSEIIQRTLCEYNIDGVSIGSALHYKDRTINEIKETFIQEKIEIRNNIEK